MKCTGRKRGGAAPPEHPETHGGGVGGGGVVPKQQTEILRGVEEAVPREGNRRKHTTEKRSWGRWSGSKTTKGDSNRRESTWRKWSGSTGREQAETYHEEVGGGGVVL
jgi:hypothetical protein